MSNESATNTASTTGRLRGPGSRRVALGVGLLVVLVAAGVTVGVRHSSPASAPTAAGGLQAPGSGGGGAGGGSGNASPSSGTSGATATGSGQHSSGGSSASPTPRPTLAPPPKSGIAGSGYWKTSNCADTFVPGDVCKVEYQGQYYLAPPNTGATVLIKAMKPDGTVLVSQSYSAPEGGHRFGAPLEFTIPQGVHEVDMVSLLLDSSGKTITASVVQQEFAS